MTKADIVRNISSKSGVDRETVKNIVDGFMEEVKTSLGSHENVYLRGFGTFEVRHRAAKKGQNIRKKITVVVPEKDVVAFKPGKEMTMK